MHDDVIKWKYFPHYWPYLRGIHRSPVNIPHKGHRHGALMFSLICARINGWVNNREAGDLRRHHAHYDFTIMGISMWHKAITWTNADCLTVKSSLMKFKSKTTTFFQENAFDMAPHKIIAFLCSPKYDLSDLVLICIHDRQFCRILWKLLLPWFNITR